ncbi:MAG: hypothetical protein ACR2FS_03630 [Phormidesmis sp.]
MSTKLRKGLIKQKKLVNALIAAISLVSIGNFNSEVVAQNNYFSGGFPPASGNAGRVIRQVPEASLGTQQYSQLTLKEAQTLGMELHTRYQFLPLYQVHTMPGLR